MFPDRFQLRASDCISFYVYRILEDVHLELVTAAVEEHITQNTFDRLQEILSQVTGLVVGDQIANTYRRDLRKFKSHYKDFYKLPRVRRLCKCGAHLFPEDANKNEKCPMCPTPTNHDDLPVGMPMSLGSLGWHSWRLQDIIQLIYMDPDEAKLMKSWARHEDRTDTKVHDILGKC